MKNKTQSIQSLGGIARSRKMTKKQRSESARHAAMALWAKRRGRKITQIEKGTK